MGMFEMVKINLRLLPFRTSQISIGSTNPFEEDMVDDDAMSVSGYSIASMPNRPYRKKRRAPLPPKTTTTTTTNKTDDDKASSVSVSLRSLCRLDCGC